MPDDVRAAFGKLEVHKSLKTGDHAEAKRQARFERLRLDAEWVRLRRLRQIEHRDEQDDREIVEVALQWFVVEEKKRQGVSLSPEEVGEAEIDLNRISDWGDVGSSVTSAINTLLHDERIELPNESLSRRRLERLVHAGMIEGQKRLLLRNHASLSFALDPEFGGISSATAVYRDPPRRHQASRNAISVQPVANLRRRRLL